MCEMTNRVEQLRSEANQRSRSPHVVQYSTQSPGYWSALQLDPTLRLDPTSLAPSYGSTTETRYRTLYVALPVSQNA